MKTPTIKEVTPIKASPQAEPYDLTDEDDLSKLVKLIFERAFVWNERGELEYKSEYYRKRVALLLGNLLNHKYYIAFENKILFSTDGLCYECYKIEEVNEILKYEYKKLLTYWVI